MKKKIIVSIVLICATIFGIWNYLDSRFSTEHWKNDLGSREKMFNNLIEKYNLKDMNKDDIKKLLGEPLSKEKYSGQVIKFINTKDDDEYAEVYDVYNKDNSFVIYQLNKTVNAYSDDVLYIKFDNNDKVIKYAIGIFTT